MTKTFPPPTPEHIEIIRDGVRRNRLASLERAWNQWVTYRAARWDGSWQQEMASRKLEKIGPEIIELRRQCREFAENRG